MKKSYAQFIPILSMFLLLSGCVGYDFNAALPEGIERVALLPIVNQTDEEALEIGLTRAVRRYLQTEARVQLVSPAQADALIEITLTDYHNWAIAYDGNNRQVPPSTYNQRITAHALLRTRTQAVLKQSQNYGEALYTFSSDLPTTKRAHRSNALEELARLLCSDVLDHWK